MSIGAFILAVRFSVSLIRNAILLPPAHEGVEDMPLGYMCCRGCFSGERWGWSRERQGKAVLMADLLGPSGFWSACVLSALRTLLGFSDHPGRSAAWSLKDGLRPGTGLVVSLAGAQHPPDGCQEPPLLLVSAPLVPFTFLKTCLTVLGLQCCLWAFSSCDSRGYSSCSVWVSYHSELPLLQNIGSGHLGSVVAWLPGFRAAGFVALGVWDLLGPRVKPVSPELQGWWLTIGPPGKHVLHLWEAILAEVSFFSPVLPEFLVYSPFLAQFWILIKLFSLLQMIWGRKGGLYLVLRVPSENGNARLW